MNQTTRELDNILEQSVGKFMDDFFYSKITEKNGIPCRRIYDIHSQYMGIDTTIGKFCIDEKVKVKGGQISKVIEYPSFEVSTRSAKTGNVVDGWFVKEDMKTDFYAFISVFTNETEWQKIRYNNINKLIVLFVSKKTVLNYVGGIEDIKRQAENLREFNSEDGNLWFPKFKLKISMQIPEEPVNLVIKRSTLLSLPHSREVEINRKFYMDII